MRLSSRFNKFVATVVVISTANLSMPLVPHRAVRNPISSDELQKSLEAQRPELMGQWIIFSAAANCLDLAMMRGAVPIGAEAGLSLHANAADYANKIAQSWPKPKAKPSRKLSMQEMSKVSGLAMQNPYFSGSSKYSLDVAGVDLMTGNMTTGGQDLSFEVGFGVPVNVARTYSLNNPEEGPFGPGWTLSADVRTTAGGIAKSDGAPSLSVPITIQDRHPDQRIKKGNGTEISGLTQPVEAVQSFDANASYDSIARDVDGVWTPPGYDSNIHETTYQRVAMNGQEYDVATQDIVTTPDGMVYTYQKKGEYIQEGGSGTTGIRSGFSASNSTNRVPSNLLKLTKVTDRQGNETLYIYSGTSDKIDSARFAGLASEEKLVRVEMPSGQKIWFTWGTGNLADRITSITDGTRTITYNYDTYKLLTEVVAPDGGKTQYVYEELNGTPIIKKIRDARGLWTEYKARETGPTNQRTKLPYVASLELTGIEIYEIIMPNGHKVTFDSEDYGVRARMYTSGNQLIDGITVNASVDSNYSSMTLSYNKGGLAPGLTTLPSDFSSAQAYKVFRLSDQSVVTERSYVSNAAATAPGNTGLYAGQTRADQRWGTTRGHQSSAAGVLQITHTDYNFQQKPLRVRSYLSTTANSTPGSGGSISGIRTMTEYAYYGWDKYMQEKAVRVRVRKKDDSAWATQRISMKDYFDRNATAGKKGQMKATYVSQIDTSNANSFTNAPAIGDETASTGTTWKHNIAAGSAIASSSMDYDTQGRVKETNLLRKIDGSTKTYARTKMEYGATTSPWFGGASLVTEGIKVNTTGTIFDSGLTEDTTKSRTTSTLEYDTAGRTIRSVDANSREFRNTYDGAGRLKKVERKVGSTWERIVETTFGTTVFTVEFGQPLDVYDEENLSGTSFWYVQSGVAIGQPEGTADSGSAINGFNINDAMVSYTYNAAGERETATYETLGETARVVAYKDYVPVGLQLGKRTFQTVQVRTDAGSPTSEEFHYRYDKNGRILESAFAQTKEAGATAVGANGSYYDDLYAKSRTRAVHNYNVYGELTSLNYYRDYNTFAGGEDQTYITTDLSGNTPGDANDTTGSVNVYDDLGRRTSTSYKKFNGDWTETFSYPANLDYLIQASYSDNSNWNRTWTYDAGQNRNDVNVDILNRITGHPGNPDLTYTHNNVGERAKKILATSGAFSNATDWYHYNAKGEMRQLKHTVYSTLTSSDVTVWKFDYRYRPDGLRIAKIGGFITGGAQEEEEEEQSSYWDTELAENAPTWRTAYDGQMPMWEDYYRYEGGHYMVWDVTRSTLGGRGVDMIERQRMSDKENPNPGTASRVFPLYDGHGNTMCEIARSGNVFTGGNFRCFDAWGQSRVGAAPSGFHGYCGNLGHKEDPESGLTYMRARYYEPGTGRFLTEDPSGDGLNWYSYCGNDPVNAVDSSGRWTEYFIEGYKFIIDLKNNEQDWHFHIYEIGKNGSETEVFSRRANSWGWHGDTNGPLPKKVIKALQKAMKSGNHQVKHLVRKLMEWGGFGLIDELKAAKLTGMAFMAISSLDAYFQLDMFDFFDTLIIIGMGGRNL